MFGYMTALRSTDAKESNGHVALDKGAWWIHFEIHFFIFCASYICCKAFECKILKGFLFGLQGGVGITILYFIAFILSTLKSTGPGILLNT